MKHHKEQPQVYIDIRDMSHAELEEQYDIEIDEGGVYDYQADRDFPSLIAWATYIVDQDNDDNYAQFSKRNTKGRYDDERY